MAVFKERKKEKAEDKKILAHSRSDYGTFAQCRGEKNLRVIFKICSVFALFPLNAFISVMLFFAGLV